LAWWSFSSFSRIVVFFAPEARGYFLEHNNFIPADPLKTPAHIAPVWYFTPYYSILRATTDEFVLWCSLQAWSHSRFFFVWSMKKSTARIAVGVIAIVLLAGLLNLDVKVWGVGVMATSVMIFFFLLGSIGARSGRSEQGADHQDGAHALRDRVPRARLISAPNP